MDVSIVDYSRPENNHPHSITLYLKADDSSKIIDVTTWGGFPGTTVAATLKGRLTQSCPKGARLITGPQTDLIPL